MSCCCSLRGLGGITDRTTDGAGAGGGGGGGIAVVRTAVAAVATGPDGDES